MNAHWRAPDADGATTHAVEFRGSGGEYFRIWLVNVALNVLTLGLFWPWASVRTRRYFRGCTSLAGQPFEYRAAPWRIFLGRAGIAAAGVLGIVAWANGPWTLSAWTIAAIAGLPWLINETVRFNMRNTTWRGAPFDFAATYHEAALACLVWPLTGLLTLFAMPAARGAWDRFRINHTYYGESQFRTDYSTPRMFRIFAVGFVLIAGALVAMIVVTLAMITVSTQMHRIAERFFVPVDPAVFGQMFALLFEASALFIAVFIVQMARNLTWSSTTIAGRHRIVSTASPWRVAWIALGNAALTVATFGFYWPFAKVRHARYRLNRIKIITPSDFETDVWAAREAAGPERRGLHAALEFGL